MSSAHLYSQFSQLFFNSKFSLSLSSKNNVVYNLSLLLPSQFSYIPQYKRHLLLLHLNCITICKMDERTAVVSPRGDFVVVFVVGGVVLFIILRYSYSAIDCINYWFNCWSIATLVCESSEQCVRRKVIVKKGKQRQQQNKMMMAMSMNPKV